MPVANHTHYDRLKIKAVVIVYVDEEEDVYQTFILYRYLQENSNSSGYNNQRGVLSSTMQ